MYGTSVTRISGLASGMDTDSIVKKLIQAESYRLNKMQQDKQKYQWESDGYRQWNSDAFSFSTTLFNMTLSSNYGTFDVSSSLDSDVTGTATAAATPGTYNLEVDQLAHSAAMQNNVNIDPNQVLAAGSFTITTTDQTGTNRQANISVNGTSEKIGDLVSKLNSAADSSGNSLGLQASYDSTLHQFILRNKNTGASTSIKITGETGGLVGTTLGFSNQSTSSGVDYSSVGQYSTFSAGSGALLTNTTISSKDQAFAAADACIKFNGATGSYQSNNISVMGVNFVLKNTTGSGTASTITVTRNIDTEVKNIEDFVNKYNDMLDKLNKAIEEPVYSDYPPLTDDQRSAMTDTQIQQWETKAKSGLFHNDSILTGLVNNMRNHMTATVPNGSKYNSLASIGIESSSWEDKGRLYVNKDKLRAALQDDPDAVKNLFIQNPTGATSDQKGVIQQLYTDFNDPNAGVVKKLSDKAGRTGNSVYDQSFIGKMLSNLNTQIDDEKQRLNDKENQYYNEFSAMEQAMSKYNSQSAWLGQQLGKNG